MFKLTQTLRLPILSGGEVSGPKINGKIISPSADWARTMPSGNQRMDVRALIKTNDGQLIYVSYNGVIRCSKEINDRLDKGGFVKADECYWISSPTFETSSANYSWLNEVVAVGKLSEIKTGEGAHIKYEIYSVR
jgi:adenine-specific DNA methylase